MAYIEIDSDLLLLAAEGGDRNRAEVARRLREMTPAERRDLRSALARLDAALDEVQFALHAERHSQPKR